MSLPFMKAKLAEIGDITAVTFAFDPCGNAFIATKSGIVFFDDECDEIKKADSIDDN